ncbi:hypothetical protein FJT64_011821 [Amphibalanus amphitrite]|uniref:Uncharacterized protein n=1 Tax=Amphibalanus amphitrite TaxID=1232801 RepID=A0A6A4VFE4_AMPAM|nr:hypothetical protein FJT64_011821 [Amphibalanus amphitrite]
MANRSRSRWSELKESRHVRFFQTPLGILHLVLLALNVLCVSFSGHYLGMYRGVHLPGYDLFRPEAFFVICCSGCLMVTVLLLLTVLASSDSHQMLFRTVAPELAFGGMSCLWLVASIVYLAEIVGRNIDYQLREPGFPLKILTARVGAVTLKMKTASAELGRRSRPLTIETGAPTVDSTPVETTNGALLRSDHRRLERAPSSPPFVGLETTPFPFAGVPVSSSAVNLQIPSESVRRLTEKTLSQSISLHPESSPRLSVAPTVPSPSSSPPMPSSPEYARVSKPPRRASGDSTDSSSPRTRPLASSATELGGGRGRAAGLPPLPPAPPAAGRVKPLSRPPAVPPASKKPSQLRTRDMRRSVSTPNDVDEPLNADVDEPTFASSGHLDQDPANLTFEQRRKMLERKHAEGS